MVNIPFDFSSHSSTSSTHQSDSINKQHRPFRLNQQVAQPNLFQSTSTSDQSDSINKEHRPIRFNQQVAQSNLFQSRSTTDQSDSIKNISAKLSQKNINYSLRAEAYSEPCETSKMKHFANIIND